MTFAKHMVCKCRECAAEFGDQADPQFDELLALRAEVARLTVIVTESGESIRLGQAERNRLAQSLANAKVERNEREFERDAARAEVEWLKFAPSRHAEEVHHLRTVYAQECREEEREACAKAAEAWADSQDRVALLKLYDAPCSAESHLESAIIGRRVAAAIRARGGQG